MTVDTGSVGCTVTNNLLKRLGRKIQEPTDIILVQISGEDHHPLGQVKDLPIVIDELDFPTNSVVTDVTFYELIVG